MAKQGNGYWISSKTGEISKVDRHERWPYIQGNLEKFGLEQLEPILQELLPTDNNADEIRIILCKAGLIRTRQNGSVMSIQFYADRNKVSDYLLKAAEALQSVNEYATTAWIHNLKYNDSISVPWDIFLANAESSKPILSMSEGLTDIPFNEILMQRIDNKLLRHGLIN